MQAKEKDYKFTSGLSQWIIGFLEEKHRLGYKYEREYFELKNLDRFSIVCGLWFAWRCVQASTSSLGSLSIQL